MGKLVALTLIFALLALLTSACGGGGGEEPTPTASPVSTPTPLPTATVTPSAGDIQTPAGTLLVRDIEVRGRFGNQAAAPGYQILVVSLEPKDTSQLNFEKGNSEDFVSPLGMAAEEELYALIDQQVYIQGSDGSRVDAAGWGTTVDHLAREMTLEVAFTSPTSAHDFELFWPGNSPIDLGM